MTRLRWRAIARALGVPRSKIRKHAAAMNSGRRRNLFAPGVCVWTLFGLRCWATDFVAPEPKTIYPCLSLGPDGLRIEER